MFINFIRKACRGLVLGFTLALIGLTALPAQALDLNQGAFDRSSEEYIFGHNSIPAIKVVGAPADADWSRWAMLHDGQAYRLYAFKSGSSDTMYQFGFNRATSTYEHGYNSIPVLKITGAPVSASVRSIAMLHDGSVYRLYMQDAKDPTVLHQFGFNRANSNYEYGHQSIPTLRVTGFPADADWNRWGMLHDGTDYRFYAFKGGAGDKMYQAAFNAGVEQYQYGYRSIKVLPVLGFPANSNRSSFSVLHDRSDYRFYFKNR